MNLIAEGCEAEAIENMSPADALAKKRTLVEWLNSLFPSLNIPLEASDEELRMMLFDGIVLCCIVNRQDPISMEGSIAAVIDCLLSLRNHFNCKLDESGVHGTANCKNQTRKKWFISKDDRGAMDVCHGNLIHSGKNSLLGEEKTASMRHGGHKFHEVFQLKQGRYSDIPVAKISDILKSNGLDNAPTQSLLSVINGILDESIDRNNGEMPLGIASLLRKVVQEVESRISTQTEHVRKQNDFIKTREEKYQLRIRVLETLASRTNEETQVEKTAIEESNKQEEQQALKLVKDKEIDGRMILELEQELESKNNTYEHHYQQLDVEAKQNEVRLQEKIKEGLEDIIRVHQSGSH